MIKSFIVERLFLSLSKFKLNYDSCEELVLSKMFSDTMLLLKNPQTITVQSIVKA
jgi:hypothetical protein